MSVATYSQEASLPHPQSWDISLCVRTHSPGWCPSAADRQASFYQGTGSSKCLQLSEMFMAAAESSSLASVKDYAEDMAAKSDARFKRTVFQLLFDWCSWNFSLPPFKENAGCLALRKKKGWSLILIKLGFFKTVSSTPLQVLQPSSSERFVTKTLNFKGIEGTSQWLCARCPYLRGEWGKGLGRGPGRYEPRETVSHQRGASVQLRQDNINTVISKSYSRWRVIPSTARHELEQKDSQETQHHLVQFPAEMRAQKILVMLQFSLSWGLYSKTGYHLRQRRKLESTESVRPGSTKPKWLSSYRRGGELRNTACITEFIYLPNTYFSVALGTACSELSHREDARLLARVPRDGLWNDQLNLTDRNWEEDAN